MQFEDHGTDLREEELRQLGELMTEDGLLENEADVDGLQQSVPD